jgi:hypothetical protein
MDEMIKITRDLAVPRRQGERPHASEAPEGTMIAHQQQSQNAPRHLQEEIYRRAINLPHVTTGPSLISVPGARAFNLHPEFVKIRPNVGTEFAHLHPPYDGSLHVNLNPAIIQRVEAAGWGEVHPRDPRVVMIWGPRDEEELEIVWSLIELSYLYARGEVVED